MTSADKLVANNLRVVVTRQAPGPVTVRVMDPTGIEVRRMYEGVLQPGRWVFDWDGRLQNGGAALPGRYKIEVDSDAGNQAREVMIR